MIQICFNNTFIDETAFQLHVNDRAFKYGDGLFETIIYNGDEILFLEDHLSRLESGIRILSMSPKYNFADELKQNITQIIHFNRHQSRARIRIQVWRKEGGLYTPSDSGINYLIQSSDFTFQPIRTVQVALCKRINLSYSAISHLKTCNALPYIMASLEKKELGLDDLILSDTNGDISEATSANIFWFKDGIWYTPSLLTGCIAGVMRINLIRQLKIMNFEVREVEENSKSLLTANGIMLTNVTGIRMVGQLENAKFDPQYLQGTINDLLFALHIKSKDL